MILRKYTETLIGQALKQLESEKALTDIPLRKAYTLLREYGLRLASNQVKYNLLHRTPEKNGVIETAKELGISIIAYLPLQQGMLTGRFHNDLSATDNISLFRRFHSGISRKNIERTRPLIDTLNKLGEKYQKTPAQISLNWLIYSHGEIVFAIPGATKLEQAQSNIKAQSFRLSLDDIALLNKVSESI